MNGTHSPSHPWKARLACGVWFGLALALARAGVLFAMERIAHDAALELVLRRLAAALPAILLQALGLGLLAALALGLAQRARLGRRAMLAVVAILVLVLAAAFGTWLAGWGAGDASRALGLGSRRGRLAVAGIAGVSVVMGVLLALTISRLQRREAPVRWSRLLLPLLAAAAIVFFAHDVGQRMSPEMRIRRVVGRLVAADASFEVLRERASSPPRTGVLCPSPDYATDGSDMTALILPPPAGVAFELAIEEGTARLFARAGVDHTVLDAHGERLAGESVRFTAVVNGETAHVCEVPLRSVGRLPGTEWRDVGGGEGLALSDGDRLELHTSFHDAAGAAVDPKLDLAAGFGGLTLERSVSRARTRSSPERPNVVLVVMDTLRADRLGTYGYARPTSPQLDRLAARGLLFEAVHAASSWTWPSTASILTGTLPQEHGVVSQESCFLADDLATLAEALQEAGLSTAAFSGNALIVPGRNFDQGFELFDFTEAVTRKSRYLMPGALEWIAAAGDTRFFLYLQLMDPHSPLVPHPEGRARFAAEVPEDFDNRAVQVFREPLLENCGHTEQGERATEACVPAETQQHISDLYDACVWTGDLWLGRLLDELERQGLADRTIIAFTSDHGEELFDHGQVNHGQSLYRELVRVPLVLAGPGIPAGVRATTPVSNRHLAPTLARLAGAAWEGAADARDLVAGLEPGPVFFSTERGWWNGRFPQQILGLREGPWALHFAPRGGAWGEPEPGPEGNGSWRLFDVGGDPAEQRDLSAAEATRVDALRRRLVERTTEASRRRAAAVPAGTRTVEMLRGLGYIGEDE